MSLLFVDTGGWHARYVASDPRHADVLAALSANTLPLVTTDYIVDETLTLLRARGQGRRAVDFGRRVFDLGLARVERLTDADLAEAWRTFRDRPDRAWSFTDCTSLAFMRRLHLKRALTLDRHFAEFGFEVVP